MKIILSTLLLFMSFILPVYGSEIDSLGKTVVFLRQQAPKMTIIDGKAAELFYRFTDSQEYRPMMDTTTVGTGFIMKHHNHDYLVTAKHVAQELLPTGEIIFNLLSNNTNSGNASTAMTFQTLSQAKSPKGARWFHHPKADISIHPMAYPRDVTVHFVPEDTFQKNDKEIKLLNSVYILGFPLGLGVSDTLSPLAKEAKIASKLTTVVASSISRNLHFYLLDQALAEGYSGAPVFYREDIMATHVKPSIKIGERPLLLGIQSIGVSDLTGGKISLVVPISYMYEILNSDDFQAYEKSLPGPPSQ